MPVHPPEVDRKDRSSFDLIGERGYVRATDVLAAMVTRLPGRVLTLSIRHPLTGPAILSCPPSLKPSVVIRAGAEDAA